MNIFSKIACVEELEKLAAGTIYIRLTEFVGKDVDGIGFGGGSIGEIRARTTTDFEFTLTD